MGTDAKKTFADNLKYYLELNGKSQRDLVDHLGVSSSTVSDWCNGAKYPRVDKMQRIADWFGIPMSMLTVSKKEISLPPNCVPLPETEEIPLLGRIACGEPILAVENWDGTVRAPVSVHANFALTCKGWSMTGDRIQDGDTVYIKECPEVENGEIAAVLIGEEATLKHVYYSLGQKITLKASNPAYSDLVYEGEELNNVRILGKAVAFLSEIK